MRLCRIIFVFIHFLQLFDHFVLQRDRSIRGVGPLTAGRDAFTCDTNLPIGEST